MSRRSVLALGAAAMGTATAGVAVGSTDDGTGDGDGEDGPAVRRLECGAEIEEAFTGEEPRFEADEVDEPEWDPERFDPLPALRDGHRYREYRFDGREGERIDLFVRTERTGDPDPDDAHGEFPFAGEPAIYLLDADGTLIASMHEETFTHRGVAFLFAEIPADGEYRIVAMDWNVADPEYRYWLHVSCWDREPPTVPERLECGSSVTGELSDEDRRGLPSEEHRYDLYSFDGECGDCVRLTVTAEDGSPHVSLVSPDGDLLAVASGEGEATVDGYRLGSTGTYGVLATSVEPDERFAYDLTLECW
ncbi:lactonase family protein [Natronorarus salvus]|uniref:hypothetical protein n=1 Tax=Natronorarus salvus TaxID=3117733 RepID=UPI002F263AA9